MVKEMAVAIDSQLEHLTVNAPDWKTHCTACKARTVFWKNEDHVPLDRFVDALLARTDEMETRKIILNGYIALLHFTGIFHSTLKVPYPFINPNEDSYEPSFSHLVSTLVR
ncbi:hypothetical protein C8R48DRAFT_344728 [Suillus tomentosus]|nr:hypothetical protein C8R48DRAFT_344728 [Suillus tomentosus]